MQRPTQLARRLGLSALLLLLALPLAGCTAGYRGTAVVSSGGYYEPDLVYVSPGVYVVADYDYPVFYTDNFYWRYGNDGRWWRSRYYDRGYVYARPPQIVARIDQPYRYRNYRGGGYISSRDRGRTYDRTVPDRRYYRDRDGRLRIRDHRR